MENIFSVTKEFSSADFGDKRLTDRLVRLGEKIVSRPSESFPEITETIAGLEATYRFLGNPKVSPEKILAPHFEATAQRVLDEERVVIAHDSTKLIFGGKSRREEIGWLSLGNQGFLGHFALALSRGKVARPLGVLGLEVLFRHGKARGKYNRSSRISDPKRESHRWGRLVKQVDNVLSPSSNPIHVMDREADDYELFSQLIGGNHRFVIRIRQNRAFCRKLGGKKKAKLFDCFDELKPVAKREVVLSSRRPKEFTKTKRGPKPRKGRKAELRFFVTTLVVPKPQYLDSCYPEALIINCVHVQEVNPSKGEEPVDWKLFTNEPIENVKDIMKVVDDYRSRWLIEEYFKALKTGCSYQKRQLESKETLLNALAIFTPVAVQLLVLKTFGREYPQARALYALSPNQIELLKCVSSKSLPQTPTLGEIMLAIAAMGGHIPNNGPPGWIVLGRGLERLLTMEVAWNAARQRCDQS